MGEDQVPQPVLALRSLPEYGGQSAVPGLYATGAPKLIIEVAVSRHSRDFGAKNRLYDRMGVLEYLIVVPPDKRLVSFIRNAGGFEASEPVNL
jgi:Uma2 family endonuclease